MGAQFKRHETSVPSKSHVKCHMKQCLFLKMGAADDCQLALTAVWTGD